MITILSVATTAARSPSGLTARPGSSWRATGVRAVALRVGAMPAETPCRRTERGDPSRSTTARRAGPIPLSGVTSATILPPAGSVVRRAPPPCSFRRSSTRSERGSTVTTSLGAPRWRTCSRSGALQMPRVTKPPPRRSSAVVWSVSRSTILSLPPSPPPRATDLPSGDTAVTFAGAPPTFKAAVPTASSVCADAQRS